VSPTRESAERTYRVLCQFAWVFGVKTACLYAGQGTRSEQVRVCQLHPDIVIATPGRMLNLATAEALYLRSVSLLVIDEADNLLQMGYLNQLCAIVCSCQRGCLRCLVRLVCQGTGLGKFRSRSQGEFLELNAKIVSNRWMCICCFSRSGSVLSRDRFIFIPFFTG
jgi:hypothetical protein